MKVVAGAIEGFERGGELVRINDEIDTGGKRILRDDLLGWGRHDGCFEIGYGLCPDFCNHGVKSRLE